MRLPPVEITDLPDDVKSNGILCDGILYIGDGALRILGCFIAWLAMLHTSKSFDGEALTDPLIDVCIGSFFSITTKFDTGSSQLSPDESALLWVIRQNQAAKAQPVTSNAWASMIRSRMDANPGTTTRKLMDLTTSTLKSLLQMEVDRYHPKA